MARGCKGVAVGAGVEVGVGADVRVGVAVSVEVDVGDWVEDTVGVGAVSVALGLGSVGSVVGANALSLSRQDVVRSRVQITTQRTARHGRLEIGVGKSRDIPLSSYGYDRGRRCWSMLGRS
jgi:hypothetical protein